MIKEKPLEGVSREVAIWAIDPFEKEVKPDHSLVHKLTTWARDSNFELQSIHVLPLPNDLPEAKVRELIEAAEKASEEYLQDLGVKSGVSPRILPVRASSREKQVEALLEYAEDRRASAFVVSSHGRSGVQRWVLGSFAESLLLRSNNPILFLTHLGCPVDESQQIKRVLFATDFSDYSREAFFLFLKQGQRSQFDVTLFHSVSLPPSSLASSGFGPPVIVPENYFPEQVKWAKEEASRWTKIAEGLGVVTRWNVKDEGIGPDVGSTVLSIAQSENVDLIAMASVSGAISSVVMGSVARNVCRANLYPVLVYGPKVLQR